MEIEPTSMRDDDFSEGLTSYSILGPLEALSRLVEDTTSHMAPERRKNATPEEVMKLACNPPPDALVGFSYGSSIPNPGPCGAGALLILPGPCGRQQ
jgi:hypothetical protein